MNQPFLPRGPEELTPLWFTTVFRENVILTAGEVVRVQTEIIGQDQGFTGVIARVRLQYTQPSETAPSSVVVKIPTASRKTISAYRASQVKDAVAARRFFERCKGEVMFYQQIAPLSALPVPRLYYGAADDTAGCVILVLEDFQNVHQGDVLGGCSRADATLVIEHLAQFHAQWWDHPQLETFSWLPRWGGDSQAAQSRYVQCIDPFLQRYGSRVPRQVREMIEALASNYGAVRERLSQSPVTLIHGDLHVDNLLFLPSQYERGMRVLDWQSVARGRGVIDLALFLFGSLETTTRRAVEGDLLRRYHEVLRVSGVTGYDLLQVVEDCRLGLLWLFGAQVVWLGSLDTESLHERELALVDASLTEEHFTALLDHDVGSLLPL
jgi:thiamine kinase-like enzyme